MAETWATSCIAQDVLEDVAAHLSIGILSAPTSNTVAFREAKPVLGLHGPGNRNVSELVNFRARPQPSLAVKRSGIKSGSVAGAAVFPD